MENKCDVIVVGGGLAGLTSAYILAKSGFDVMVLERANNYGQKNVSGGVLYGNSFQNVFSEICTEAPIERYIKRKILGCISDNSVVAYDYSNGEDGENLGFSVLRVKFDKWLSEKVMEAGADITCGVTVDNIIFDHNIAKGISIDGENLYSDVVILAEGANTLLTEKIGFREQLKPYQVGVGVKEVISLPETDIHKHFNIDSDGGAAIELFGTLTEQIEGGGFVYTNRDSISVGLVFTLSSYKATNNPPYEILEHFKNIPYIKRLICGGDTIEYSAHLVPESGLEMKPKIYGNGILIVGDAAGFTLKNGRNVEGMNYAIESGKLAAETIIEAVQFNEYSEETLSEYQNKINNNNLFKRLKKFNKSYRFFQNPRLYSEYPKLIKNFTKMLFFDGSFSDDKISQMLFKARKTSDVTVKSLVKDLIQSQRLL